MSLVDDLEAVEGVRAVTSALDVPLLESPPISLTDLDLGTISTLRNQCRSWARADGIYDKPALSKFARE